MVAFFLYLDFMIRRRYFIKSAAAGLGIAATGLAFGNDDRRPTSLAKPSDPDFWKVVRNQFPLTENRVYLNSATFGPSPYSVVDAVTHKTVERNTTGEYSGHEVARKAVADFIGAQESEISLTHNTTEGINFVAGGIPLNKGDEVIMTSHEHVGNALPWLARMKTKGFTIKVFEPATTAAENLNRINSLISKRTKVIAVPHITCTTGLRLPIKEISKLAAEKGIYSFVDGAHGPGMFNLDMNEIGCDFYAACGHKWMLGPSGTGFLFVKQEKLEDLVVNNVGAYSDTGWALSKDEQRLDSYVPTAHRFDYGSQSAALSYGLKASTEFMNSIGKEEIQNYTLKLASSLSGQLTQLEKVELLSSTEPESMSAMVGFRIKGMDYQEFGRIASKAGFRIRLVGESGLNSIRISTHIFNNEAEVGSLVKLVAETKTN